MQQYLKSSSLLSYTLKPPSVLIQVFKTTRRHRKNFSTICVIFGHGKSGGMGEYTSVPILMLISEMINTVWSIKTPLDCIVGYIMEYDIGDRSLKRLTQRSMNIIDGYISSYCSILNSH